MKIFAFMLAGAAIGGLIGLYNIRASGLNAHEGDYQRLFGMILSAFAAIFGAAIGFVVGAVVTARSRNRKP